MTRKEYFKNMNESTYGSVDPIQIAIKALEKESLLDKIKAEIMDTGAYEQEVNGETEFLKGINYCLGVIDKYKEEMESKE